ncbi:MAG: glycosyltransferase family 9 protein [Caldilineae bacterium]|nr:MAG: glycosyltransferase family 9 protein [Caldilineae bacterium]
MTLPVLFYSMLGARLPGRRRPIPRDFPLPRLLPYNAAMPAYPHPPRPDAPPTARVRLRRLAGRGLARVLAPVATSTGAPPHRLLLIRPDHLGDLLFLGPALRLLRQHLPGAHLTLAVGPWAQPALPALHGCFDELLVLPFPAFERGARAGWPRRWGMLPLLARRLRGRSFDTAMIFRPDHWWGAMLAALADIPRRRGYDTPETTPWLTHALPLRHEHAAAGNLRLVADLLSMDIDPDPRAHPLRFRLDNATSEEARALLQSLAIPEGMPLIIIHPGAGAAVKLWELQKWVEVARRLARTGARILLTGGPAEAALTAELHDRLPDDTVDLGGKTSFRLLAALLARADLVLGPDSGPLHLAVAVETPTVHLFGPADAVRFGPWGNPARHVVLRSHWSCVPCGRLDWPDVPAHGCVRDITPEQVVSAAEALLNLHT